MVVWWFENNNISWGEVPLYYIGICLRRQWCSRNRHKPAIVSMEILACLYINFSLSAFLGDSKRKDKSLLPVQLQKLLEGDIVCHRICNLFITTALSCDLADLCMAYSLVLSLTEITHETRCVVSIMVVSMKKENGISGFGWQLV